LREERKGGKGVYSREEGRVRKKKEKLERRKRPSSLVSVKKESDPFYKKWSRKRRGEIRKRAVFLEKSSRQKTPRPFPFPEKKTAILRKRGGKRRGEEKRWS